MTSSLPGFGVGETPERIPQAGSPERFRQRWRLTGAGLSNVWRFGDLELPAASGRLLLRGPNGTGKTTALEALWPYLLDLNPARLAAGKARPTSLTSLMREGATGKRRYGYAWLTLASPDEGTWSFGVRLQYSEGGSPPVKVVPFAVPGRPIHDLKIHLAGRTPLTIEQFGESVTARGGQIFDGEEAYVAHLAARIFATSDAGEPAALASRLRQVRNPSLLGDVSPQAAAAALRESLPIVAEDVVTATAEALAESDATRDAFARDNEAADLLQDFKNVWSAHAVEVIRGANASAQEAAENVLNLQDAVRTLTGKLKSARGAAEKANKELEQHEGSLAATVSEIDALQKHQAYKDAGRLADLQNTLNAQVKQAQAAGKAMTEVALAAAAHGGSIRRELGHIIEDLAECHQQALAADSTVAPAATLLSWEDRPRPALVAGEFSADPGPMLVIHGGHQTLVDVATQWHERADAHGARAEAAGLALTDHGAVEVAKKVADDAVGKAAEAATKADTESGAARRAKAAAVTATHTLLTEIASWTKDHPRLTAPANTSDMSTESDASTPEESWTLGEIDQLAVAEPGQVLATADAWARHALTRAEGLAAIHRSDARRAAKEAKKLRTEADELHAAADELRAGRLLPLPRPEWAGTGDDARALGSVLDWSEDFRGDTERALLEAAVAAAGLLGADLASAGASTDAWKVDAHGPVVADSLGQLISVDPEHPLAELARTVLARIRVATSATLLELDGGASLVIGRDGTFRAGVLQGRVPGADDAAVLPAASHIGARQRRAAALARAEELDRRAGEIEAQAGDLEAQADALNREADAISALGGSFPRRETLRLAEAGRAQAARSAREAQDESERARREAERLTAAMKRAQEEWSARTRARGLPIDVEQLTFLRDRGKTCAEQLTKAANSLGAKLAERLRHVLSQHDEEAAAQKLIQAQGEAQVAFQQATNTETEVRVLRETAGTAIAEVLRRLGEARNKKGRLEGETGPAREKANGAAKHEGEVQSDLNGKQARLEEERPKAAGVLQALRSVLEVPGVADAVLDGAPLAPEGQLLTQVAAALEGRRTLTKKTVRERADSVRTKLAGIWSLDPGEDRGELLTYVLTHRDTSYTPTLAAAHASTLKQRAEQALAASEEKALREFIIGRLPAAIGTAWTRLHDWVTEVNRKMRGAAASSGVGVQVRTPMRDDLPPASRSVFQLSCKTADAERTPDQQRELSKALQALLQAAEGETMQQRVAAAVDVREWVDVYYEVTRPGGKTQRWNSRTGLSGGERRLVVLAPMLAAAAATYERLGTKALRLVALDEVPAEVDERGREGLARYIAELDLDLICTSYLWDGCPGAWDGVDAHDLEAGPDGTVVAFPMLVRGMLAIPGDELGADGHPPSNGGAGETTG